MVQCVFSVRYCSRLLRYSLYGLFIKTSLQNCVYRQEDIRLETVSVHRVSNDPVFVTIIHRAGISQQLVLMFDSVTVIRSLEQKQNQQLQQQRKENYSTASNNAVTITLIKSISSESCSSVTLLITSGELFLLLFFFSLGFVHVNILTHDVASDLIVCKLV